jgi:hypothetical protein
VGTGAKMEGRLVEVPSAPFKPHEESPGCRRRFVW